MIASPGVCRAADKPNSITLSTQEADGLGREAGLIMIPSSYSN
jgi:hypothetical protein